MSRLTRAWSDTLCVISTGGGDRRRQLYTSGDLFSLEAKGPTLVTALVLLATRGDLIDRIAPMGFDRISDSARRTEAQLKADFAAIAPTVMGGVLDAVATALRHGPETHLEHLPRMADATLFVSAAEHGLPDPVGTFATALVEAQGEALSDTVETSPFIEAIVLLMTNRAEWRGSVTRLTEEAAKLVEHGARTPGWPANASVAGTQLGEYELPLAAYGIAVERDRAPGGNRDRYIVLRRGTAGTGTTGETDTVDGS